MRGPTTLGPGFLIPLPPNKVRIYASIHTGLDAIRRGPYDYRFEAERAKRRVLHWAPKPCMFGGYGGGTASEASSLTSPIAVSAI